MSLNMLGEAVTCLAGWGGDFTPGGREVWEIASAVADWMVMRTCLREMWAQSKRDLVRRGVYAHL